MSLSYISSQTQKREDPCPPPTPPQAFFRMILLSLFVQHLRLSVCPTTYPFCPTKSCLLWRRSCVSFTIVYLVPTLKPGSEWSIRKWLFMESTGKATLFTGMARETSRGLLLQAGKVPRGTLDALRQEIKLISWLFTEKKNKKHHFLKNYKWILFIMWQQTASV